MPASCLYEGTIRHRRFRSLKREFTYRLFFLYLDLSELNDLFRDRWFWSVEACNLVSFRRADYLGPVQVSLDEAVRRRVEEKAGFRPKGPIRMLTHLRSFGLCFNPVSFYYCFDEKGMNVEAILAEITNTPWNERHSYVVRSNSREGELRASFPKVFHVSPFLPMALSYDWRFSTPGERLSVHMEDRDGEELVFDATLMLERRVIQGSTLARVLWRYPFVTFRVVVGIYLQAAWLWLRRVPFHTHPAKRIAKGV